MRRVLLFLIFVLSFCFTSSAQARKLALLVGVDDYTNVPKLKCCVNDMNTLKGALMKIGFAGNDIQTLETGSSKFEDLPTKKNIKKAIADIVKKTNESDTNESDMVFIALSGHGAQDGENVYFCPPDVDTDDLEGTCVSINKIMDDLAECKAKFKWMVVDACRNNPNQNAKGIGGKGLQVIPTPPEGIALFQSCAKGEESFEDRASGNGYFTKNFAAALSGEADSDHDGKLTLMEVCKWTTAKTKEQVQIFRQESQTPYFSGRITDFILFEDLNLPKAEKLAAEARSAMAAKNFDLAIEKYNKALDFYPNHDQWKSNRDLAQQYRDSIPKFNPMKISVPDDFATIEDAYKNVKDGGIITILPGKYELSATIVVNRPVTFRGSTGRPEDIVIDCPTSDAFEITGGSPSFQNLTVSSGTEKCGGFFITGGTPKLFRCIVTSRKGCGMYVYGEKTNPQVESCIIKKCAGSGLYINENGHGVYTDCEIYGNAGPGIVVGKSSNPTVTGCKIHDGKAIGVNIYEKSLGTFTDCEIYGNAGSGIVVSKSSNPTVTGCKIHDGKTSGVEIYENSLGTFKDCEIYGNVGAGIEVSESSNPTLTGCKIHDGKACGVFVGDKGLGTFTDCEIYGNVLSGIEVCESSNPTLTGCKIFDGKASGVFIYDKGLGTFTDCEVYGNAKVGISIEESGNPTVTKCKIFHGGIGIAVTEKGLGKFSNCEIYGNVGPGIVVSESSNPTVTGCNIHDGKASGVFVLDTGMGKFNNNTLQRNYYKGQLSNWHIDSSAGTVSGSGNTPPIPAKRY